MRTEADREALRNAVADGTITAICSDHQPQDRDAKLDPFPLTEPGISGLDTLAPLVLGLVDTGVLDLVRAIEALTSGPGRIAGTGAGTLAVGAPADVCVIDPSARWRLQAKDLASRGHNTPFIGTELAGRVRLTLVAGRVVHESGRGCER